MSPISSKNLLTCEIALDLTDAYLREDLLHQKLNVHWLGTGMAERGKCNFQF